MSDRHRNPHSVAHGGEWCDDESDTERGVRVERDGHRNGARNGDASTRLTAHDKQIAAIHERLNQMGSSLDGLRAGFGVLSTRVEAALTALDSRGWSRRERFAVTLAALVIAACVAWSTFQGGGG